MSLHTALSNYQQWQTSPPLEGPPKIIERLIGGTGHEVTRVRAPTETDYAEFVVRQPSDATNRLGMGFTQEVRIQQRAADAGIAPPLVYVLPEHSLTVSAYIRDTPSLRSVELLSQLLRNIHALPADGPTLNLQQTMTNYAEAALDRPTPTAKLIDPESPQLHAAIMEFEAGPKALCHNDLNADNIRMTEGRMIAIDWEYAAVGNPYFDVAAAVAGHPGVPADELAKAIFGQDFNARYWQLAQVIYTAVAWNWYQASGLTPPTPWSYNSLLQGLR